MLSFSGASEGGIKQVEPSPQLLRIKQVVPDKSSSSLRSRVLLPPELGLQQLFDQNFEALSTSLKNQCIIAYRLFVLSPLLNFESCSTSLKNQDCVGAIDGTYISAVASKDKQIRYRNRKGSTTQNVMCACNFDMEFTFVYAGWEGSANDCRVFQRALQKESLHFPMPPIGKYYVVDSGYPTQRGFLTPFKGERYHLPDYQGEGRQPRTAKELFNHRHASLRNVIERVFGVIKARFPILKTMSPYPLELQPRIVIACCALHNFIKYNQRRDQWFARAEAGEYDGEEDDNDDDDSIEGTLTQVTQGPISQQEGAIEMNNMRKQIANRLATRVGFQQI